MQINSINKYNNLYKNNLQNKRQTLNNANEPVDSQINKEQKSNSNVAFTGLGDKIGEIFGKYYAEPMLNKKWVHTTSNKLSKVPGDMTAHMATLGSLITSGVYVDRTLSNKDLDDEKRKTLAINQALCFVIPTYLAYKVNGKIAGFNKKLEYRYSGLQEQKRALGKLTGEQAKNYEKVMGNRLKGFKTLATIGTFTTVYRYATPVVITPLANTVGRVVYNIRQNKAQKSEQIKN